MKSTFAFLALISWSSTLAQPFALGPWRLGMSEEEVRAYSEYGPYTHVSATGGLETQNGTFEGQKKGVSFVFDGAGLRYIQLWNYEGSDYESARRAVLELFDLFSEQYGGAEVVGVAADGQSALSRGAMEAVLARVLGTAKELGRQAAEEENAAMILFFDMKPMQQPEGSRLHSQWGYNSRYDTFYVFLFQDRTDAPERKMPSIIRLEAL